MKEEKWLLNIFLDTQVYEKKNFNFRDKDISRLAKLIEVGMVELFITSITRNEIENRIKQKIEDSTKPLKDFRRSKNVKILNSYDPYKPIFNKKLIEHAQSEILDNFLNFLSNNDVIEIPISGNYANEIFNHYFDKTPPFSSKKKSEFPDAFALYSLLEWADNNEEILYIVSGDSDMKNFCQNKSNIIHINSLEETLDIINRLDDVNYHFAKKIYSDHLEHFLDTISEDINDASFDFNIEVYDVEDVEVKDFSVVREGDYGEPRVIELNENKLTIVLDVNFEFTIATSKIDPTRSPYDSEEGLYLYIEYEETEYTEKIELPVEIELSIEDYEQQDFTIESIKINNDEPYLYTIDEEWY